MRESREVSLLLKPLHLAANQSKIMWVQEEGVQVGRCIPAFKGALVRVLLEDLVGEVGI